LNLSISRDGEPVLKRGPAVGSVNRQNQYEIRTTPLPAGPRGANWCGYFNSQLKGGQFLAQHDGTKIVAECWPDDEPSLTAVVDAAIEYANEKEGTISY
jgi:hypothetical protein